MKSSFSNQLPVTHATSNPPALALHQACRELPGAKAVELASILHTQLGLTDTLELMEVTEDTLNALHKTGLLESA